MTYADRYHLTPEQSRFLAKKKWDENVYCGMKMENRAVTFPQTKTILEGVNVPAYRSTIFRPFSTCATLGAS